MPLRDVHRARHRNGDGTREYLIGDADMGLAIIEMPERLNANAVIGFFGLDLRAMVIAQYLGDRNICISSGIPKLLAVLIVWIFIFEKAVQKRGMCRINADLQSL